MSESSTDRDIAWVDQLRELGTENALVEFKRSNGDPEIVGKLISALSNAAREADKEVACSRAFAGLVMQNFESNAGMQ